MIYVSERYALGILIFDITMLITVLLFRKSKGWKERSTLDPKGARRVGYYAIGAGVFTLLLGHLGFYMSLAEYLEGLLIDSFLFYLGLSMVTQNE
jgi:hypothetical protein